MTLPEDTNVDLSAEESVRAWLGALNTPIGSPTAPLPMAAGATSLAQVKESLPTDGHHAPKPVPEPNNEATAVPIPESDSVQTAPELRLYYSPIYKGTEASKPITLAQLQENYSGLKAGESFMTTFVPNVELNLNTSTSGMSYFDTFEWLANIRAWSKWWLNPWAWWDPSRYSLDESDRIQWDEATATVNIHVTRLKDMEFLTSQRRIFLLIGWGARCAPYVAPSTRARFEKAVRLRFEKIEKIALEAKGFKEVTLGTRINLTTQCLEYYVQGTK